jgi:hypothetical protein
VSSLVLSAFYRIEILADQIFFHNG